MQNGLDTAHACMDTNRKSPVCPVQLTQAEISVETIKRSKLALEKDTIEADVSSEDTEPEVAALSFPQKSNPSGAWTSPDTSVADQSRDTQNAEQTDRNVEGSTDNSEAAAVEQSTSQPDVPGRETEADTTAIISASAHEGNTDTIEQIHQSPVVPLVQKKKRGRPKKIDSVKGNKKLGRPPKNSLVAPKIVSELASPATTGRSDQEKAEGIDFFTYVPGKTSEPIQISAVSSVRSGSEGSHNLDEDGLANAKNSPLQAGSRKTASAEKMRKRKADSDSIGRGKRSSLNPVRDSSSMQKKQDMMDFLQATENALVHGEGGNGKNVTVDGTGGPFGTAANDTTVRTENESLQTLSPVRKKRKDNELSASLESSGEAGQVTNIFQNTSPNSWIPLLNGSPRFRGKKKKTGKWSRRKMHTPAVIKRMEAQREARERRIELGEKLEANVEVFPDLGATNPSVFPDLGENHSVFPDRDEHVLFPQTDDSPVFRVTGPHKMGVQKARRGRKLNVGSSRGGYKSKSGLPVVNLSPLGRRKYKKSLEKVIPDINVTSDMPIVAPEVPQEVPQEMSSQQLYTESMSIPVTTKKSYLKPKDATKYEADTGSVCLKNIIPLGRRKSAPKEFPGFDLNIEPDAPVKPAPVKRGPGRYPKGFKKRHFSHGSIPLQTVPKHLLKTSNEELTSTSATDISPSGTFDTQLQLNTDTSPESLKPKKKTPAAIGQGFRKMYSSGMPRPKTDTLSPKERKGPKKEMVYSFKDKQTKGSSGRSRNNSPKAKSGLSSAVGEVLHQFTEDILELAPGSGYCINVRLDIEKKPTNPTGKNQRSIGTQDNMLIPITTELWEAAPQQTVNRDKSSHVSSTVNSVHRKSSEPQASTSTAPDEAKPHGPKELSDEEICTMLSKRISTRLEIPVDLRMNLLSNIKHVNECLKHP